MPVVSVKDSERFYLRILLLRKTGVISFNDLKTIDGTLCETFQEACKVLGLLDGDQHWHDTLLEAARMQMPSYLRILFAIICGFGEVENIPTFGLNINNSSLKILCIGIRKKLTPFTPLQN
ncbi:hypothetical protein AVEN_53861-1 [Araneus ventricosus]|uniref:Helitron helicase-like domain-containing protein n=1 Tax=Araneus ventricosus TaxID=182803 RepID=A0A4Y2VPU8_ARAVE|nr:hypothetical protein AVEN_53861-1 [Araneus ventricosus]